MNIRFLLTLLTSLALQVAAFAQTYTWTGATSSDWAVSTNWSPNGVPGAGHTVNISNASAPNSCVLDSDKTVATLNVSAGTLNLNTRTITTTGSSTFTGGTVHNGGVSSFNILNVSNTLFTGAVSITKTGGTTNDWAGGNTFSNLTVTNLDNNRIRLANTSGDTYNGTATFSNPNNGTIEIAYAGASVFNQGVTVNNATAGTVSFGAGGGTTAVPAGRAILTSGFTSGTLTLNNVTQNGTTTNGAFNPATFNATNTTLGGGISINATGTATLNASNFTGTNTIVAANVVLTNANKLSTASGSTIITKTGSNTNNWTGGNTFGNIAVTTLAGVLRLATADGDTFNGTANFSTPNNGSIEIASAGATTFNQGVTVNNTTAGTISFGAAGGTTLIPAGNAILTSGFSSGTLTLNNVTQNGTTANGTFSPANFNTTNTTLGGSVTVNATNNVTITTSTFTASNTIAGTNVTLNGSNLTASNTITGTNVSLLNANSLSTVSGTTSITKTSGTNDDWTGGNTFGNLIITNQDNNRVRMAVSTGDTFNGTVTFNRQSTGIIDVAFSGLSTFNAPVTVNNSSSGSIRFGVGGGNSVFNAAATFDNQNTGTIDISYAGSTNFNDNVILINSSTGTVRMGFGGTTSIAAGKAILTTGFSSGTLTLNNVTQAGTAPNGAFYPTTFSATNTALGGNLSIDATGSITLDASSFTASNTFSGANVTLTNVNRLSTVSGTTTITKTGGTTNNWTGGNTFGNVAISNQGGALLRLASVNGDAFSGTATFSNQSTGTIDVAYVGATTFSQGMTVNNATAGTISFGAAGGTSAVPAGRAILTGGYTGGTLTLNNVTQAGTTANGSFAPANFNATNTTLGGNLTVNASGNVTLNASNFTASNTIAGANVTLTNANRLSTVSGTTNITKTSGIDNDWTGGNTFGNLIITNQDNNRVRMAVTTGDTFNGTVTFNRQSTGIIDVGFSSLSTFNAPVTANNSSSGSIRFGFGGGNCVFNAPATFDNRSTGTIDISYAGASTFNENITLNNSSTGIIRVGFGGATSIAAGKAILTTGFSSGTLTLNNVTQAGTAPNGPFSPATFTSTNAILGGAINVNASTSLTITSGAFYGVNNLAGGTVSLTGSSFTANNTVTGTSVTLNSSNLTASNTISGGNITLTNANRLSTVSGTTTITKTGGGTNTWTGGNTFGNVAISNQGGALLRLASVNGDAFSGTATFSNQSTGTIDVAYVGATTFSQGMTVNNATAGTISFGAAGGTSAIPAGRAILTGGYTGGTLTLNNVTQAGTTANGSFAPANFNATNTTLGGNLTVNASGSVTLNASSLTASNSITGADVMLTNANRLSTVSGATYITKTGGTTNDWTGGNTFGNLVINNNGGVRIRLADITGDTFNGPVTFNRQSAGNLHVSYSGTSTFNAPVTVNNNSSGITRFGHNGGNSIFNAAVTFNNPSTGTIDVAYAGTSTFNQNITLNNASTGIINFGVGAGTTSIAAGRAILTTGFGNGTLTMNNVTQAGTAPNGAFSPATFSAANTVLGGNLTVTTTGNITLDASGFTASNTFTGANVTLTNANRLSTVSGSTTITKTGGTTNTWTGGNTFGNVTITNQANALLRLANIDGDTFSGTLTLNNQNSNVIDVAYKGNSVFAQPVTVNNTAGGTARFGLGAGNAVFNGNAIFNNQSTGTVDISYAGATTFNENITLNNSSTGLVRVGWSGTTTIAAGKAILTTGFANGTLTLNNITQNGTAANSPFSPATFSASNTRLGGNLTVTTPGSITIDASSFTASNSLTGANVTLNSANSLSTVSGSTTITKTGGGNNTWAGGNTFGNVTITNQAAALLRMANVDGDTFLGTTTLINQNSNVLDVATQGNSSFAQAVTVNNTAGGTVRFGLGAGNAAFSGSATFNNQSTGTIDIAYNGASAFNQGLTVNNASTGTIRFGGTGGTTSIAAGKAILTSGFADGALILNGVTQAGSAANGPFAPASFTSSNATLGGAISVNTPGNISITGGSFNGVNSLSGATVTIASSAFAANNSITGTTLALNSSTFAADNTISGTSVTLNGSSLTASNTISGANVTLTNANSLSTASGATTITKTGSTTNTWTGGNTFGNVTIQNQGTGILRLAASLGDTFTQSATFIQSGSGVLQPAYVGTSTFLGDISTVGTSAPITFGLSSGEVVIGGTGPQRISGAEAYKPIFRRLTMATAGTEGGLTLQVPIDISVSLTMTSGKINTTATNVLLLNDETVSTTVGNGASYVNGPLQYNLSSGSASRSTLNFPIGQGSDWRPLTLEVAHNASTPYIYQAEVSNSSADDLKWTVPVEISHVSKAHYWDINRYLASSMASSPSANLRTTASDHPKITLYYGANDGVTDPDYLTICKNTPAKPTTWVEIGGTGATASSGSITSLGSPNPFDSFSRFTLANLSSGVNPLPIELLSFEAIVEQKTVRLKWATASEQDNDHFVIERSKDLANWQEVRKVKGAGNSSVRLDYTETDKAPLTGISYYRLKQTDFDGTYTYSRVKQVTVGEAGKAALLAYPNPTTGLVYLAGDPAELEHVRLYNQLGQDVSAAVTITHSPDAPTTVDLSKLSTGLYFIKTKLSIKKIYRL